MAKVTKKVVKPDVDLNRWCIEMALRWPTVTSGGYGNGAYGANMPPVTQDADVIGRANKIKAWVLS